MRRPVKNRNIPKPDTRYDSTKVEKFINHIMMAGKKDITRKIVYQAFEIIQTQEKVENPLEIFDAALKNASPVMEIRVRLYRHYRAHKSIRMFSHACQYHKQSFRSLASIHLTFRMDCCQTLDHIQVKWISKNEMCNCNEVHV